MGALATLLAIIAGGLVFVVLYALFNHKIPKGILKPFINGMQYLAIVMTSSTAKRPKLVDDVLKALSVLSFDFDVMSLSCLGIDYDYGTKLVGTVALVAVLMICPLLHLLVLRSKVLRRKPGYWFETLDVENSGTLDKATVTVFLTDKLKLKQSDVTDLIEQADPDGDDSIDARTFDKFMKQARVHRKQDVQALIVRDIMLVILLFHPFVSGLAMKAWKCVSIESSIPNATSKSFLTTDMTIQCFTSSRWIGIAVFSMATIILFSIGAPAVLFFTLVRRRDKLGQTMTFKRLGILYSAWRPKYYYFEAIELIFKLLLWVAVVASTDEQIQNAAVVSMLMVFVMVRVGARPSMKAWKDQAEIVALGFSLTLKLHDMVHSYLTASKKNSIDDKQALSWQAAIDQSDTFLVGLFITVMVFIVLRISGDVVSSGCGGLTKKRGCRRCLRRMTCGFKCKCCLETEAGDGGETGEERGALEMYRLSSRKGGFKGEVDGFLLDTIQSSRKGADGFLLDNPMHSKSKGIGKGEGKGKATGSRTSRTAAVKEAKVKVGRPAPKRALRQTSRQRTESERDEKEYMDAYSEHQRVTSSDGAGRGRNSAYASFVRDVVAAARDEEENEDENSLEAFLKTLSAMAREALEQRAAAGDAAETAAENITPTIVRDKENEEDEEDEENNDGSVGIFIGESKVAEPASVMMPGGRDESGSDSAPMTWLGNPIDSSKSFKFSSRGSSNSVGGLAGNAAPAGGSAEQMMVDAGGSGGGDGGGGGDGEGGRRSVRLEL